MNLLDAMSTDIGVDYDDVSALILAIGACLALIGMVVIYNKWSHGDHNVERDVLTWAGGIILLLIIRIFIRSMFSSVV